MEQKEKKIRKKEAYEKPKVKSEDVQLWFFGQYTEGPPDMVPGGC